MTGLLSQYIYLNYLPSDLEDNNNTFLLEPQFVVLFNLCKSASALSNLDTPLSNRRMYRAAIPLPGTRWNNDNGLLNPDDIIPAGYRVDNLFQTQ